MNTLIISPALNVADKIHLLLKKLTKYRDRTIIIDDGSTDETNKIIEKYGFEYLRSDINSGVSKAIFAGLTYAVKKHYDSVLILDADGQHDAADIPKFENLLLDYDVVTGNRFHEAKNVPTNKLASNIIGSVLINQLFKSNVLDVSCGFKAFRLDNWILDIIMKSESYSFIFEILVGALHNNKNIACVDIECIYHYDDFLYTKPSEILSFLKCMRRFTSLKQYYSLKLDILFNSVITREDFTFEICDFTFYGFYIKKNDGYLLQADPVKMHEYANRLAFETCATQIIYR